MRKKFFALIMDIYCPISIYLRFYAAKSAKQNINEAPTYADASFERRKMMGKMMFVYQDYNAD